MGHYCAVEADNISDSVCYEDYFTTQLIAATNLGANEKWLIDHPVLFYPQTRDIQFGHFCQTTPLGKVDNPEPCPMFLGKVKFNDNLTTPQIDGCPDGPNGPNDCLSQVNDKTDALDNQFKQSLTKFADIYRYPWKGEEDARAFDPMTAYVTNPFIGYYGMTENRTDRSNYLFKATSYALPRLCTQQDFANARLKGDLAAIQHLKDCSLNFEIHTNGFYEVWKDLYGGNIDEEAIKEIHKVFNGALDTNQYGRTMFMYAGVPEQMIPISFTTDIPGGGPRIHTHEKIYGSSLYTQYLPMVNPDDQTQKTKEYTDDFWHAIFMSNHMNQDPDHFIRGIRGRTLWHNEYRSNLMYKAEEIDQTTGDTHFGDGKLAHLDFPAGFQKANHTSLYHGNTCDSCHIRNGSGVPLMPNGELPALQVSHGMNSTYQLFPKLLDYTHTNPDIPAMKLVLFDLKDGGGQCDDSDHTIVEKFYRNRYMNFYGNSFHVNQSSGEKPTYVMEYKDVNPSEGFFLVDTTPRKSADNTVYAPKRLHITSMDTGNDRCSELSTRPANVPTEEWPENCAEVDGTHLGQAIDKGEIGVMQLLGKRLGNTPLIEMIPDETIKENHRSQQKTINHAGCYGLVAGTRAGASGDPNYRWCTTPRLGPGDGCYLSRWGWIGDRASLEDQIANAAHVEMNISSKQGFDKFNFDHRGPHQLVRYNKTFCGPADLSCQEKKPNSDITEEEIRNMATYQRWIGIPQRSEYQVTSAPVQRGEEHFRNLGCSTCHVIDKIKFVASDNMLPDEERAALEKLQDETGDVSDYPFVSYLGTDLLLHDMGYLSQVARAPVNEHNFRNPNGTINNRYTGYIQKIRTPPLKGLRFNRFVTDSNHNTAHPISKNRPPGDVIPGCDFLLHDGRACDVIEAAYLHDGPAVKELGMINRLNSLTTQQLTDLRAFLYSL